NKEVNAVIVGKDFAGKMEAMFENDLRNSKKITLKQWRKRSIFERFKESLARLFANWL
ncbi:phospholipase D family protein, partial [Acidithiobacillus sp. GGI-221]